MNPIFHHIGCAAPQLTPTSETYARALGLVERTRPLAVKRQHVQVCFLKLASSVYLELVAPLNGSTTLGPFLTTGFYHIGFLVEDLDATRSRLLAEGCIELPE